MPCKVQVFVCPVDQKDVKDCGEPETVNGVCYDHAFLCQTCFENPTFPIEEPCNECKKVNSK